MSHNELYVENLVRQKRERELAEKGPQPRVANAQAWGVAAQIALAVLLFAWYDAATGRADSYYRECKFEQTLPHPSGEMVGIDCDALWGKYAEEDIRYTGRQFMKGIALALLMIGPFALVIVLYAFIKGWRGVLRQRARLVFGQPDAPAHVVDANYDPGRHVIDVKLNTGVVFPLNPADVPALRKADAFGLEIIFVRYRSVISIGRMGLDVDLKKQVKQWSKLQCQGARHESTQDLRNLHPQL